MCANDFAQIGCIDFIKELNFELSEILGFRACPWKPTLHTQRLLGSETGCGKAGRLGRSFTARLTLDSHLGSGEPIVDGEFHPLD
jgi:hypothetical protein